MLRTFFLSALDILSVFSPFSFFVNGKADQHKNKHVIKQHKSACYLSIKVYSFILRQTNANIFK